MELLLLALPSVKQRDLKLSLSSQPYSHHQKPSAFKCQCLCKGTSALRNQEGGKQTDAYLQGQRNKLLLVWTWGCNWARHREDTVWQQAIMRPSVEPRSPERVHSLHMGEQFPPKWLLTNGRPNYREDWWVCLACWIYLSSFLRLRKKRLHTQELKLWDKSHLK